MKKVILIGPSGSGKTTLVQTLYSMPIKYKKTQMLEYYKDVIDTPGEYIENKGLLRALIVSSVDCHQLCLIQSSTDTITIYPPNFTQLFTKPCIGIVSKTDEVNSHIPKVKEILMTAGIKKFFYISSLTGEGIEELHHYLQMDNN
ncbi:EutP/PduV family microcompartment system protein [Alkaliphilus serpentinus]|uniref:EutP/PduV family microcompartment system protein n=1 Tax=Alkaliphilus serpentinus TaxID=1482731 RepID=A0A833HLA8_9FIRM|nr:EutP/PduV family microcompartment system protein [Alkaliphilus serpentinus]KAB3525594.1 EutP/PduV family microcompartment system protein [Alkaliphilus serpentinus]